MTAGPWRPVSLHTYAARISDLWARQDADIVLIFFVWNESEGRKGGICIIGGDDLVDR